jgi:cytochrome c oxidase cbb3-type subunit 1
MTTTGMLVMFFALLIAGLVQGFLWKELAPWEASITSSLPFWWIRTVAGSVMIVGVFMLATNMLLTALSPRQEPISEAVGG